MNNTLRHGVQVNPIEAVKNTISKNAFKTHHDDRYYMCISFPVNCPFHKMWKAYKTKNAYEICVKRYFKFAVTGNSKQVIIQYL